MIQESHVSATGVIQGLLGLFIMVLVGVYLKLSAHGERIRSLETAFKLCREYHDQCAVRQEEESTE